MPSAIHLGTLACCLAFFGLLLVLLLLSNWQQRANVWLVRIVRLGVTQLLLCALGVAVLAVGLAGAHQLGWF